MESITDITANLGILSQLSASLSLDVGKDWRRKRDDEKALECFSEAIGLDPDFVDAYFERGHVWERKKKWERAFADYDRSVRLAPANPHSWQSRGRVHAALGNYDAAISDLERSLELNPESHSVQSELRRVRRFQKDSERKQAA